MYTFWNKVQSIKANAESIKSSTFMQPGSSDTTAIVDNERIYIGITNVRKDARGINNDVFYSPTLCKSV